MSDLILAHDIGTSGVKATLYSLDGTLVLSATVDYGTHYFNSTWVEQDPEDWWSAVAEATRRLLAGESDARGDAAGIGAAPVEPTRIGVVSFSGQMMGCVCVDVAGAVLRPAIIWADGRAVDQSNRLLEGIDMGAAFELTGHRLSPAYSLPKLMWVRDNEPEIFARVHKVLNPKDFIILRMTNEWVTDKTDASGTLLLDLRTRSWSERMAQIAGIPLEMMPRCVPSPTVVGAVTSAAAEQTGLQAGTPVVCGAGDGMCAAVGAGCVEEGTVYATLGSSSWIASSTRSVTPDAEMRTFTWAHAVPDLYSPCGTTQAAGAAYDWARRQVHHASGHDEMNRLIETSPVGANSLLFLPYVLGERTPWWNPDACGAFIGLKMEHTREDMLRSVLEGIFLTMRLTLEVFRPSITAEVMDVTGGFARGEIRQRVMANVFGMPLAVDTNLSGATSMGAAVIGGVGAGLLEDFSAVDRFRTVSHVVEPDLAAHERYTELLPLFVDSYRALEPIYTRLAKTRR